MSSIPANRLHWVLIPILVLGAYFNSFIEDDAFISFRYAQNLVQSHELTWNPGSGERVEGYTNFLWVLMMAGSMALAIDPVLSSKTLGLAFAFGTLLFSCRLAELLFRSPYPAPFAVTLIGTNYTFSAYATRVLETPMQAFFIAAGAYVAITIVEKI